MISVYLDNNTATLPSEKSIDAMLPFLREKFTSLLSPYDIAQEQVVIYNKAMDAIGQLIGADPKDQMHLFASGAQAIQQAIFTTFFDIIRSTGKNHFLTSKIDEAPTIMAMHRLEKQGALFTYLMVNHEGFVGKKEIEEAISPRTGLISISIASGLTGVIHDLEAIRAVCKERGILLHVDISHLIGRGYVNVKELDADMITFGTHTLHAPKECGFMWINPQLDFKLFNYHENLNMAALLALKESLSDTIDNLDSNSLEMARLRAYFEEKIQKEIEGVEVLFQNSPRIVNTTCIAFAQILNEPLLYILSKKKLYANFGGGLFQKLSFVLQSCFIDSSIARSALSFAISKHTTVEEIDLAVIKIKDSVNYLRNLRGSL